MQRFNSLFIVWALIGSAVAYVFPSLFLWFKPYIVYGLALIMFGMGSTVTWDSFKSVVKSPGAVAVGVFLQYLIMPLAAFLVSKALRLPPAETVGMVLVGSCPGGTASNVICYLGGANVTLSITLTTISTLLAVFATPFFAYLYIHATVDVPAYSMLVSVFQMVIVPVILGAVINGVLKDRVKTIRDFFPSLSVVVIVFIIACIVALNRANLAVSGALIFLAVILHNLCGLFFGYFIPKMLGFDKVTCRTISIEVGMQNSGLSVALAAKHFAAMAAATLPGAIFSVWHNITGSILASLWRRKEI